MSINRFAKSRDANERDIFDLLRAAGYAVWPIDTPADAIAAKQGRNHLVEVKNAEFLGKRDAITLLTKRQKEFRSSWKGKGCIHTGSSAAQILDQLQRCANGERNA